MQTGRRSRQSWGCRHSTGSLWSATSSPTGPTPARSWSGCGAVRPWWYEGTTMMHSLPAAIAAALPPASRSLSRRGPCIANCCRSRTSNSWGRCRVLPHSGLSTRRSSPSTPRNHLYCYTLTPQASDEHVRGQVSRVSADCVLLGHTHWPMIRRIGRQLVVNPGSVGQPRDGDPRASFAVIENGYVALKRVAYDVERTVRGLRGLPLPAEIADRLVSILRAGR
jgi:diadenosine tetraphosphatase ApaH/serine/threonine PP2A family protein phosphatase